MIFRQWNFSSLMASTYPKTVPEFIRLKLYNSGSGSIRRYFPDINSNDNIWGVLTLHSGPIPSSIQDLCKKLMLLWAEINVGILHKLAETMPQWVHVVFKAKSGLINISMWHCFWLCSVYFSYVFSIIFLLTNICTTLLSIKNNTCLTDSRYVINIWYCHTFCYSLQVRRYCWSYC